MSELQRKRLQELRFESTNVLVVALIIGKTAPRVFNSKRTALPTSVLRLTVRDSKQFFTNCICWGSEVKINDYYRKHRIGDIIDIISPRVTPISRNDREFHPQTSTTFALTVNEGSASIEPHMVDDVASMEIGGLREQPVRAVNMALNLADIHSSGSHMVGQGVDLFVVVKLCKPVRTIRIRSSGQEKRTIEVIVVDRSYPAGMPLNIWHDEWIDRAEKEWRAKDVVLQLVDVKLDYSTFYKRTVITFTGRTIIIENPKVKETRDLLEFASTVTLDSADFVQQGLPDPNSITTIMTVQQIYDRCNGETNDETDQFTAVLYAIVTQFDLDGHSRVIGKKCKSCKRFIPSNREACLSDQCQMDISFDGSACNHFDYYFDINTHFTDHTGTLVEGRLMNQFAEQILNCRVEEFEQMDSAKRTSLKWTFLLERVCAKLVIKKKSATRANVLVMVLDMKTIELDEVAANILVY